MSEEFVAGAECTINGSGDLYMTYEARPFIGAACIIIKRTKAGLIQVQLKADPKMRYSFPERNVDIRHAIGD
jgi:hypothetical protein